ncbi:thioredoxin fold domain-containing protein [Moraxella nasovis]|uniref:thioredoxin fold domain-containing protein n=1 Tax=Moraxella nasovis TaxID=2904121 RepID=UPI001F607588|nr:thioredoxin fold domain-containing protein [Moraxella nasovis]UNU74224.1 thioredoxin fold domain-containing protein [Moraxella nasovis]
MIKHLKLSQLLLAISISLASSSLFAKDVDTAVTNIRQVLSQALPSHTNFSISPSPIADLYTVNSPNGGESILITKNADYAILGNIENNPSDSVAITADTAGESGTPVSDAYKSDLLANMADLKNIDDNTVFYHTSIDSLLWGISGFGGTPFLVSKDARHFINGEISAVVDGKFTGLDADFEQRKNRHVLSRLDTKELIIYPAKTEKAVLYVATDINCPYCRVFHQKIGDLNAKGVTIKVIGYPIYDESIEPMRQIWCESDNAKRAALLNLAMKDIAPKAQCQGNENHLAPNQTIAQGLAIFATPAIYTEQGTLVTGL